MRRHTRTPHVWRLAIAGFVAAVFSALPLCADTRPASTSALDLGDGVALEFVEIKAGNFNMGSPTAEKGRRPDEEQANVNIPQDFLITRTPITRGQFKRFVVDTSYKTEAEVGTSGGFGWDGTKLVQKKDYTWRNPGFPQTDEHPVVLVTLKDAEAFAAWAAKKLGRKVTLPTEAQWEYACRAGTATRFYSGDRDQDADAIAWHKDDLGADGTGTRPVGKKKPNAWGLLDMSGNVYQWCSDTYGPYKPGAPVVGPVDKPRNVLRGGSFLKGRDDVRSAARYRNTPGSRNADNGFRLVAVAPEKIPLESPRGAITGRMALPLAAMPSPGYMAADPIFALLPLLFCGLVVLILIAVVIAMVRAFSSPPLENNPPRPTPVPPRLADDGFWFDPAGLTPGQIVRYTYEGPQGPVQAQFVVEASPQGQFIYTGVRPANLALQGLAFAAAGAAIDEALQHQRRAREAEEARRLAEARAREEQAARDAARRQTQRGGAFGGFPSAY